MYVGIPVTIQQSKIGRYQAVYYTAASFVFILFISNSGHKGPGCYFCIRSGPLQLIIMETYANRITLNLCSRSQLLHDNIHTVIKNTQIALELKMSSSTTFTLCDLSRHCVIFQDQILLCSAYHEILGSWLENKFILEEWWMIFESWQISS